MMCAGKSHGGAMDFDQGGYRYGGVTSNQPSLRHDRNLLGSCTV